jgi:hypothetical protein
VYPRPLQKHQDYPEGKTDRRANDPALGDVLARHDGDNSADDASDSSAANAGGEQVQMFGQQS